MTTLFSGKEFLKMKVLLGYVLLPRPHAINFDDPPKFGNQIIEIEKLPSSKEEIHALEKRVSAATTYLPATILAISPLAP